MERIAFAARRHRLALAIITGLSLIFIACVSVNAQPTPDDLPPLPPSCVFPSTCYVDQANDADEADGTVVHPFRKFINGMALAREWGLRRNSVGEVIVMPGHYAATGVYTYPTTITAPSGNVVLEGFPALRGDAACPWGSRDCNRCAPDVVAAFNRLRSHGDILGFRMGDEPPPRWGPGSLFAKHWQGLTRIAAGDGRTFVIAQDDAVIDGAGWSVFTVVNFGSRDPTGLRYRSNRLNPELPFEWTPPPASDIAYKTVLLHPENEHPGSPQALGELMLIGAGHEIYLYDMADPAHPQRLGPPDPQAVGGVGPILVRPNRSASSVAMAKLADGRYLIVAASSDARPLDFYISHAAGDLLHYSNFDRWHPGELVDMPGQKYGWDTFQALNLVTECGTGKLYLIATGNLDKTSSTWSDLIGGCLFGKPCYPDGEDWASLYEIDMADASNVRLTKVAEFHAYCTFETWGQLPKCESNPALCLSNVRQCNFDAAAGVYVDPTGRLILYASEHDNDGPIASGESEGSVKMMEFRETPHGSCETIDDAWIELFEHDNFRGQGRMIDYRDRHLENYAEYHQIGLEYFGDQASSARWCIPEGWGYRMFEHSNYGGVMLTVSTHNGGYGELPNMNLGAFDFNDLISSSMWVELSNETQRLEGEVIIK